MAAAAQEPKADTRAELNVDTDELYTYRPLRINLPGNNGFALEGDPFYSSGFKWSRLVAVDERSLARFEQILEMPFSMENNTFMCNASPDVHVIGDSPYAKLTPKKIEEILAAAFPKERVEIYPARWLAPFAASPTNPGGVAESDTSLLLDSGASFHAVGDVSLLMDPVLFPTDMRGVAVCVDEWLTDPVLFPNDMRGVAVCADGTHLRIVGTGTLQKVGFSIPDVRYVDGLKKNLISVSQLDKDHGLCCCFHSKKCEVMLADGTVVGGAILRGDGMYELYFLEVPPEPEE